VRVKSVSEVTHCAAAAVVVKAHTAAVRCVVLPSAAEMVSSGDDGTVRWWNISDGTCTHTSDAHTTPVLSITMIPDGGSSSSSCFVGSTADDMLQIWRSQTLKQVIALPTPSLPAACVLADGDIVTCSWSVEYYRNI